MSGPGPAPVGHAPAAPGAARGQTAERQVVGTGWSASTAERTAAAEPQAQQQQVQPQQREQQDARWRMQVHTHSAMRTVRLANRMAASNERDRLAVVHALAGARAGGAVCTRQEPGACWRHGDSVPAGGNGCNTVAQAACTACICCEHGAQARLPTMRPNVPRMCGTEFAGSGTPSTPSGFCDSSGADRCARACECACMQLRARATLTRVHALGTATLLLRHAAARSTSRPPGATHAQRI